MSGRKRGYVRPNFRGVLRSACAEVTSALQGRSPQLTVDELDHQLKELRKRCRDARQTAEKANPGSKIVKLLDRMDARREDLVLLVTEGRNKLAQARSARYALEAGIKFAKLIAADVGANDSQVTSALAELNRVITEESQTTSTAKPFYAKFERGCRELELWLGEVERESQSPPAPAANQRPSPTESPEAVQVRLAHAAELSALKADLEKLQVAPSGGWDELQPWLKSQNMLAEAQQLAGVAQGHLETGDLVAGRMAIAKLESHRTAGIAEAEQNRQAANRTRLIADAIMETLFDRKYDTPTFGFLKEGDPLSGIQVRADVPNRDGRGNIRVDIHFDGQTEFEVENIAEGEEHSCRDVLESLAVALSQEGLKLDITDWGRARDLPPSGDAGLQIPSRVVEIERERE